jgi:threonyl-tRNA synthetase
LLSIAGAYWKGDASRQQLQRLYATAFFDKKELEDYLFQLEEAKKRDHRVLGKRHELFLIDPKVGQGLILWLPKGAMLRRQLENFIYGELIKRGYTPVNTPPIGKVELYETSGHYPYYADSQFPPIQMQDGERFLLRPMNCPHHVMIYKSKPHSYRDLPVRIAEFGMVHRFEQSGELNGMTRVRGFTQDDAHIFCTEEQVESEFRDCLEMTQMVLKTMGFDDYRVRLSFRDWESDKYVGDPDNWRKAQAALENVCRNMDLPSLEIVEGEAAFYGPKADFIVKDCLGRQWQLGTVQLDYNLPSPERFDLEYIGADNKPHKPVMIHRAPFGSFERFTGILIEHFAAAFPLWLAPEQVRVLTVSQKFDDYANTVVQRLLDAGIRATGDFDAEKIGAKIRTGRLDLVPYLCVVGAKEEENNSVALRSRKDGELGEVSMEELIRKLDEEVKARAL